MKAWLAALLCLVMMLGEGPRVAEAAAGITTAQIGGKRYLRLGDWARANNLDLKWLRRDESVQLTNRTCRMVFNKDSREAELNGLNVSLSYPVVLKNGTGFIAEADVETVIRPVLNPPRNRTGAVIKRIVIDPGHGGRDPGFQDGSQQEKKYTLLLAQELRDQLKRAGFDATLTRSTDTYVDLAERAELANRRKADLFISLHWNSVAAGRNELKGPQVFCLTPAGASSSNAGGEIRDAGAKPGNRNNDKNMFLAYQLQKSLVDKLGAEDRGIRRARFAVLTGAEMPAVLIEGGFMSHPVESKRIYDASYRRQMAQALLEGVQSYKRQVER
jgi:N-acetylmuramoyl-L-alanine amidase